LLDPKITPLILSSDVREAANLIQDDNIDVKNKEEKVVDNVSSVYPTTAFIGGLPVKWYFFKSTIPHLLQIISLF
jgi:hypothetical protein